MGEGMGDDAAHSGSWLKKLGKAAEAGWSMQDRGNAWALGVDEWEWSEGGGRGTLPVEGGGRFGHLPSLLL